ncbi:MAG: 3'-5' exonuclease, partial [Burkholderiales bacterium]
SDEALDRLANVEELVAAAQDFLDRREDPAVKAVEEQDGTPAGTPLESFLQEISLVSDTDALKQSQDAVTLMTVHSAKGLEFHSVFISGLEEGLFPHENSVNEDGGLEEERRLMYVALTRAQRRLVLSFAQSRMLHGQTHYHIASRFLREIPENLLQRVNSRLSVQTAGLRGQSTAASTAQASVFGAKQPWRIGQNVQHPKFGAGVIVNAEGRGADARVQVNFHQEGVKWLMIEYAKLSPA